MQVQAILVVLASAMVPATTGCNDACLKTAAARTSAVVLVSDAQLSLDQARSIIMMIPNQEVRDKAMVKLSDAIAALRAADKTLAAAASACTSPDVGVIFRDFAEAWFAVAPFLGLMGGPGAGSRVSEPLVIGLVK